MSIGLERNDAQDVHDGPNIPERVVGGGQRRTVGGVGDLGDEEGGGVGGECEAEANHEARQASELGSASVSREYTYREPMNMPMEVEAVWRAAPPHMMMAPMRMVGRRPKPSER